MQREEDQSTRAEEDGRFCRVAGMDRTHQYFAFSAAATARSKTPLVGFPFRVLPHTNERTNERTSERASERTNETDETSWVSK